MRRTSRSADETVAIGRDLGRSLRPGDVVGLAGPLGSGKTRFISGVCDALGVQGEIVSPTFVLMHRYDGVDSSGREVVVNHFDLYRIGRREELDDIGFRDLAGGDAITLVEWADLFPDEMPGGMVIVRLDHAADPNERTIEIPSSVPASS